MIHSIIIGIIFNQFFLFTDFRKEFGNSYLDALDFVKDNKTIILEVYQQYQIKGDIMISVLFPERIRYSIYKDYFETLALSTAYVEYGSKYVDFSIGDFQMKPSFIEKLDSILLIDSTLAHKYEILGLSQNDELLRRREIVRRLEDLHFQLIYSALFYDYCLHQFNLYRKDDKLLIYFLASAYNAGFNKSFERILSDGKKPYFPNGADFMLQQHVYADVSWYFFQLDYVLLFSSN